MAIVAIITPLYVEYAPIPRYVTGSVLPCAARAEYKCKLFRQLAAANALFAKSARLWNLDAVHSQLDLDVGRLVAGMFRVEARRGV